MNTQTALTHIERLAQAYNDTTSRQVLTQLRALVTKTERANPLLQTRINEIFATAQLSREVL